MDNSIISSTVFLTDFLFPFTSFFLCENVI
nr:MAG TPA: hypothetical protein [Caudoviricetes sp.]